MPKIKSKKSTMDNDDRCRILIVERSIRALRQNCRKLARQFNKPVNEIENDVALQIWMSTLRYADKPLEQRYRLAHSTGQNLLTDLYRKFLIRDRLTVEFSDFVSKTRYTNAIGVDYRTLEVMDEILSVATSLVGKDKKSAFLKALQHRWHRQTRLTQEQKKILAELGITRKELLTLIRKLSNGIDRTPALHLLPVKYGGVWMSIHGHDL